MAKIGIYAVIRFVMPIFQNSAIRPPSCLFGLIGMTAASHHHRRTRKAFSRQAHGYPGMAFSV
jgi:hypothetical protein